MGMYSEAVKVDLSLRHVCNVAAVEGLPMPQPCEHGGHAYHFRASDIQRWVGACESALADLDEVNPHLFYIARILHTHALDYLNRVSNEAPVEYGNKRKNYFRKMTRKYRFLFL